MNQRYFKLTASVLVAIYCFYYLHTQDSWHFIDNMDLIIHEAGHYIFFIFGTFINMAGGSLLQLIMPVLFAFSFFRTEQNFSGSLMMYWLAINFFNVGQYAADAVSMNLPLLGGDNVIHDWNYLLSTLGFLQETQIIANVIYFIGILCIIAGLIFSYRTFKASANKIILC
jgi:hypothetical protein